MPRTHTVAIWSHHALSCCEINLKCGTTNGGRSEEDDIIIINMLEDIMKKINQIPIVIMIVCLSMVFYVTRGVSEDQQSAYESKLPVAEPFSDHLRHEILVDGYPDFLEPYDSVSVWVMNPGTEAVELVSAEGVIGSVPVEEPCGGMTSGFNSLWVASCKWNQLVRIDPETRVVIAKIDAPIVGYESTLAEAEGSIWVMTDTVGTLLRVDPKSNSVEDSIQVRPNSFGVVGGFGAVWVSNTGPYDSKDGSVQRIDPITGRIVATIPVGPSPLFLTAGEGSVWVVNQGDGTVSRIDPVSNVVIATIPVGVEGIGGDIAVGGGAVWVRAIKTFLSVIDPEINEVVARFGPPAGSGGVRVAYGSVWLSAHDVNFVWQLDTEIRSVAIWSHRLLSNCGILGGMGFDSPRLQLIHVIFTGSHCRTLAAFNFQHTYNRFDLKDCI
jgi:YVTN family beta-propeller protein